MKLYVNLSTREYIAASTTRNLFDLVDKAFRKLTAKDNAEGFDIGGSRWKRSDRIVSAKAHQIPYIICEFQCLYRDKELDEYISDVAGSYTTKKFVVRNGGLPDIQIDL